MPQRIRYDVMVVESSPLAKNLYQVLFSGQNRYRLIFAEEFASLFKRSARLRPDLLLVSGNKVPPGGPLKFPCPTVLVASKKRSDLRESLPENRQVVLLETPFYPYDLLSLANRLVQEKREARPRGRPPRRRAKK